MENLRISIFFVVLAFFATILLHMKGNTQFYRNNISKKEKSLLRKVNGETGLLYLHDDIYINVKINMK